MKNFSVLHPYKTTSKCAVKYVFVLVKLSFNIKNDEYIWWPYIYIVSGFEASEAHAGRRKEKKLDLNWVKEKEIIEKSANELIVLIEPRMQGLENILYSTYRHNTRGLSGFSILKIRYGKGMKTELKTTRF